MGKKLLPLLIMILLTSGLSACSTNSGSVRATDQSVINKIKIGKTTKEEVNEIMRHAALHSELVEQIQYCYSNELVSTDVIGNPCPSVFDSQATIVAEDGNHIVLYVWYDNEYGYTKQVFRLAKYLAEVIRLRYY